MAETKSTKSTTAKADESAENTQTEEGITDEQRQAAAKAADENAGQLANTQAVAAAAGLVNQQRQQTALGERQAAISIGNDPETADDEGGKPVEDGPFAGQLVASDHYAVVSSEFQGRQVVEVRPAGWVGPGFEFPASRVKEVAKLLGQIKNLPKQDDTK